MAVIRTHRPVWSRENCLPCSACTRRCPVRVFPEQAEEADSLRGRVARKMGAKLLDLPPCQSACPIGQDVRGYVDAIARGDFDSSLRIVLDTNALPAACGRLCHHPCERACVRGKLDVPVPIRALKRAALEGAGGRTLPAALETRHGRVAIIGAGPAGLSAAYFLARFGRDVTVFEAAPEAGGLLRWAVPAFHLPREVLRHDVQHILEWGVRLETGRPIDLASGVEALRTGEGYQAVIIATGTGNGGLVGIPGEDLPGCTDAVSFARTHCEGAGPRIKGPAIVYGSGYEAAAVARMALRQGAAPVSLLTGTTRRTPTAEFEGIGLAEEEGVHVVLGTDPVRLVGTERLEAVRCKSPGGDMQFPAVVFVAARKRASGTARQRLLDSGRGIFGAGEAFTGPRNLVRALASGKQAAEDADRYLEDAR